MTIHNARSFITRIRSDSELRTQLNGFSSSEEIFRFLEDNDLSFNGNEFFEAHSFFLANARSEDEHDELKELLLWWNIITGS